MKFALTFLAGVLAQTGIIYFGGIRSGVPMFFAGVLAVAVPVIGLRCSKRRVRALARLLNAFVNSGSGVETRRRVSPRPIRRRVSLPPQTDRLVEDVVSALVNAGAGPSVARKAAMEASRLNRDFNSAYRASLQLVAPRRRVVGTNN
jgi:hypothetical protein